MDSFWQFIVLILFGCLIAMVGVFVGAGLMFKGSRSVPGERFWGGVPKGEVFSIPDALDSTEFPEQSKEEQAILEKTERFLAKLGGGKG